MIGRTAGGLSSAQALPLLRWVQAKARSAAPSLVEFMPARDVDGLGALTAAEVLCAALGVLSRP